VKVFLAGEGKTRPRRGGARSGTGGFATNDRQDVGPGERSKRFWRCRYRTSTCQEWAPTAGRHTGSTLE
jgi:hypothetical protein